MTNSSDASGEVLMAVSHKPSSSEDDGTSHYRRIIPLGKPYLTKVNGKLVFARDKPKKKPGVSLNLLGEVFGVTTKVVHTKPKPGHKHKRSRSVENFSTAPLVIGGVTYVPQAQQAPYSAPIPQQPFPGAQVPVLHYPPQYSPQFPPCPYPHYSPQPQPQVFVNPPPSHPAPPTDTEFKKLTKINADVKKKDERGGSKAAKHPPPLKTEEVKTTITIAKHICAHCGRLRSRRYHISNPIKPGEIPVPAFCAKCQKDASSTSASDSECEEIEKSKAKKAVKKKNRLEKKEKAPVESESEEKEYSSVPSPIKASKKSKNLKSRKRNFERTSSDEHAAIEEKITLSENRQPRGRARDNPVLQEHAANRQSPSPLQKQSEYSPQSFTLPYQSGLKENAERPPPLPPKIRDNHQQQDRRSPSVAYRLFEPLPAHHKTRYGDENHSRGAPVYLVDSRRFYDQHEPRQFEQSHEKRDERLSPNININIHNGKEYKDEEPENSGSRRHRREGNQTRNTRRVQKHHSFEVRESSQSSSNTTRSFDGPHTSSGRQLSQSEQNVDRREPQAERKSTKDHTAKEQSKAHPRKDGQFRGQQNSHPSQSSAEYDTMERLHALRQSPLDAQHTFDAGPTQKIQNEIRASRYSSSTSSQADHSSNGRVSPASSQSDKSQRRRRQLRQPSPPPSPAKFQALWGNLGHGYSMPKDDIQGNEKQKENRDLDGPLNERVPDMHHTHGGDSKPQTSWKASSDATNGSAPRNAASWKFCRQVPLFEDLIGGDADRHPHLEGGDSSASSRHDDSRRRRRHERGSHAAHFGPLKDETCAQPENGNSEEAIKKQSALKQKKHSHGWAEPLGQGPQIQKDPTSDPAADQNNTVLSVADAAKYYQDDWENEGADTASKSKGKERASWDTPNLSTPTEVSFPAANAAKYYRDDWAKEEPILERPLTEKVEEDEEEHSNANISSRRTPISPPRVTCSEISPIFKTPVADAFLEVPEPPLGHDDLEPDMGSSFAAQSSYPSPQVHRRILNASYKGKEVRPPSTIMEGSEGAGTNSRINGVVEEASTELLTVRRPCSQERRDESLRQVYDSDSQSGSDSKSDKENGTAGIVGKRAEGVGTGRDAVGAW